MDYWTQDIVIGKLLQYHDIPRKILLFIKKQTLFIHSVNLHYDNHTYNDHVESSVVGETAES